VVQRGNNRQAIFFESSDYVAYLNWLHEALGRYGRELHAYGV
jgi:putative transposase